MSSGGATPLTEPVGRSAFADLDQIVAVEAVHRLGLGALHDHERAPHQVVVDLGELAGPPHHGLERERLLGVQQEPV